MSKPISPITMLATRSFFSSLAALALAASSVPSALAEDWPQWRGPLRNDVSAEKGLLSQWSAGGPKQLWMSQEAGLGYSGFSVAGGKLFTMGLIDGKECVLCFDAATGKRQWSTPLADRYENNWGDGPRSTPTVSGKNVFALTGRGTLASLNLTDGSVAWKVDLQKDLGGKLQSWGYTESILVEGDLVICTPGGAGGTMAGLKKSDGSVVWRTSDITVDAQYASPIAIDHAGARQIVQLTMNKVFGISPSDGKALWINDFSGRTAVIPTPIYDAGEVYIAAGYGTGCTKLKLGGKPAEEVYKNNVMVNHHGGVIKVGDHLYGHSDKGGWTCQSWATGDAVWQDKSLGKGAVAYADGHLYCLEENSGTVVLAEASPTAWSEKGRFTLTPQTTQRKKDGRVWVHPVISGGKLFLRDQEMVYCFDVKKS
jgi:outer membrane protein assembly factor BamB